MSSELCRKRIVVTGPNASLLMGGEAQKPIRFFDEYLKLGHDVYLIAHERNRWHLQELYQPSTLSRISYVDDSRGFALAHRWVRASGRVFKVIKPALDALMWVSQQRKINEKIKHISETGAVDLVHVSSPIAVRAPLIRIRHAEMVVVGPLASNPGSSLDPPLLRLMQDAARLVTGAVINAVFQGRRSANVVVYDGSRALRLLKATIGKNVQFVECIHNGVTDDWLEAARPDREKLSGRVVFVGRLTKWKGVHYLLDAAAALPHIQFQIIGKGELEADIRHRIMTDSLQNVSLTPWMSHSDLRAALSQAALFVTPSYAETGGTALQEAMALGLPVIATRWGGHIKRVPQECGVLIDPPRKNDEAAFVDSLVSEIRRVISDGEMADWMGRRAREYAREHFRWRDIAETVLSEVNGPAQRGV